MTLCVAWVRRLGDSKELVIAADSRFTGGGVVDMAPKIFPLSRGDGAIACAGDTSFSFPVACHIRQSMELNVKARTRAEDFTDLVHYVENLTNSALSQCHDLVTEGNKGPGFKMILAGYSARKKDFLLKSFRYDWRKKLMKRTTQNTIMRNKIAVIGDDADKAGDKDLATRFRVALRQRLASRGTTRETATLDMEPLHVLKDFIDNTDFPTVGGHLQMVKVYDYMSVLPYGLLEEDAGGTPSIYYFGRRLMNYETFPYPIYNPSTGETTYMKSVTEAFRRGTQPIAPLKEF